MKYKVVELELEDISVFYILDEHDYHVERNNNTVVMGVSVEETFKIFQNLSVLERGIKNTFDMKFILEFDSEISLQEQYPEYFV